jgi:hypothetical protein
MSEKIRSGGGILMACGLSRLGDLSIVLSWDLTLTFGGGFAIDSQGNVNAYYKGGGWGAGAGFRGGFNFAASDADTICDLMGPFVNQGGNLGLGAQVSLGAFEGQQTNGKDVFGLGIDLGFGEGASAYAGVTNTPIVKRLFRL